MRLSTLGDAVTGTSTIGVNGATPAALVGVTGGSKFGPAWLTDSQILYQNITGPILQSYDIGTTALATVDAGGQNDLSAGAGKWAAFLSGSGVRTNISVGPFATAALGDVSTDFGELAITLNYPTGPGITVYSSAGATLLSLPAITAGPIIRIRGHLMMYQAMTGQTGWYMAHTLGGAFAFAPRTDEPINWITPVTTASGKTLVMERSDRLTLRYSDRGNGWQVVAPGHNTFNPDVMEVSAGVIRLAWSVNQGESPDALELTDLTLATGATRNGVVVAGAIVWSTGPTLTMQTFPVGALQGQSGNAALIPPVRQHVIDPKTKLMVRAWQDWSRAVSGGVTSNTTSIQSIPPSTTPNTFSTIASPGQNPIVANGASTLNLVGGVSIDSLTNTITIDGSAGLLKAMRTLNTAEVLALPTTAIQLIAAPGAGLAIVPWFGVLFYQPGAVAFSNIDAAGVLGVRFPTPFSQGLSYVPNDAAITFGSTTNLTDLLGSTTARRAVLVPTEKTEGQDDWGPVPFVEDTGTVENTALMIDVDNNGAGDFTFGDGALKVVVYYTIETV